MLQFVHEDFPLMLCVGCEGFVVCSEFEVDGLCRCCLSFDSTLGPTGIAMRPPYPVEIVTMYISTSTLIRYRMDTTHDQIHNDR